MDDDCEAALRQLQVYLDGECAENLEAAIREHLADCPPCEDRAAFEQALRAVVARHCRESAPPGLVDRVLSRIDDPSVGRS